MSPTIWPFSTVNDTWLTAVNPPKRFVSPSTVSTGPPENGSRDEPALGGQFAA
jgi:hypothetical protein